MSHFAVDLDAVNRFPFGTVRDYPIFPLSVTDEQTVLAVPSNVEDHIKQALEFILCTKVEFKIVQSGTGRGTTRPLWDRRASGAVPAADHRTSRRSSGTWPWTTILAMGTESTNWPTTTLTVVAVLSSKTTIQGGYAVVVTPDGVGADGKGHLDRGCAGTALV